MHAIQHGKPILAMSASFQEVAGGLDHQDEMPTVPAPEDLPSMTDLFGGINEPRAQDLANRRPIDMRHNDGHLFFRARRGAHSRAERLDAHQGSPPG